MQEGNICSFSIRVAYSPVSQNCPLQNENHDNYDLSNYALGSVKSYDWDSKKVYNWERNFIIDLVKYNIISL